MSRQELNPVLLDMAAWRLQGDSEKAAFVPQGSTDPAAAAGGGDPAAGGMPPGDPMAAGGMPPGDPMAGGMPPGAAPVDPMAAAGGMMPPAAAPAPGMPGAPGAPGAGGKLKIDPAFIYMELSRVRKLLTHMMKHTGIEMPPDILDDGAVAMAVQGQPPQSSPLGQGGEAEQAGGAPPGGGALPGIGGAAPLGPMEAPGGAEKPAADNAAKIASDVVSMFRTPTADTARPNFDDSQMNIDALSQLSRSLNNTGS